MTIGSLSVSPGIVPTSLRNFCQPAPTPPLTTPTNDLTERGLDVLRGLVQGQSNQEIADSLTMEKTTVRSHMSDIPRKLELDNRTQADLYAVKMGLGRPTEPSLRGQ